MTDHYHDLPPEHEHFPPELDRKCPGCNGDGYANGSPEPVTCARCQGSGYVLTPFGRTVLAFLQRHPPALTRAQVG